MIPLVLIGIVIALFYYVAIKPLSYWKDRGVIQGDPVWLLGDTWRCMLGLESFADMIQRGYNLSQEARYTGLYQLTTPLLLIKDPKLLKQLTIKDFEYFMNHKQFVPEEVDSVWSKNLISLKDHKWKETRPVLSPFFSSSKMKMMYSLMAECSENFVQHYLKLSKGTDIVDVTVKEASVRFSNDIIASAAFGIHIDSLKEPNNTFFLMGRAIMDFPLLNRGFKFFAFFMLPKLLKFLKIEYFDRISREFFVDVIKRTMKMREESEIVRPDMIHLLLEAKRGVQHKDERSISDSSFTTFHEVKLEKPTETMEMTEEDISAHTLIFFFAGAESVSSLICFMSHELAVHPEIQIKLREEIVNGFKECNGKLTYDALMKMKYLEMVVLETLRKWPNFVGTDRECNKPYVLRPEKPNEKPLVVEKGTVLALPIMALHYDPQYFPDPQRFDPERFSDENKKNIDPYTYFPFGLGPRYCIGSRFALLEIKALFAHLLKSFEIVPTKKTAIPIILAKSNVNNYPVDGINLGFKPLR